MADVCHSPPSISAPRSHGKLRRRLTGTGVGSNFRFVSDLELKPAFSGQAPSAPPAPAITAMACSISASRSEGKTPSLRDTGSRTESSECSELGAQSMHADGGHDRLDGLRLNACIPWKSCQCKIWTGLSSTGPWPSATCTGAEAAEDAHVRPDDRKGAGAHQAAAGARRWPRGNGNHGGAGRRGHLVSKVVILGDSAGGMVGGGPRACFCRSILVR